MFTYNFIKGRKERRFRVIFKEKVGITSIL